ncbi:hypothetical protein [Paraburkholderia terrae]|uniref:hypothetical protein n=1 Tax=Paraburkholderia terrae TaxID=311230 RepID=UPI003365739C
MSFRPELDCCEDIGCELGGYPCDVDAFLPFKLRAVGVQPDTRQFDQVIRLKPVSRARHGDKLTNHEIAEHLSARFVVEDHRHGQDDIGARGIAGEDAVRPRAADMPSDPAGVGNAITRPLVA